jgi:hypothetical protein
MNYFTRGFIASFMLMVSVLLPVIAVELNSVDKHLAQIASWGNTNNVDVN